MITEMTNDNNDEHYASNNNCCVCKTHMCIAGACLFIAVSALPHATIM